VSKLAYIAGLLDTIATLRAENARLREALEKIAAPLDLRDVPHVKGNAITWRMDVARAALAAKEPGHASDV
jgi:hypothetical protein